METTTEKTLATENDDPNTRLLPKQVEKIVSKGSKEALVPGDGTCLIGTTALHIEGDTEQTTQLAKNLNTHIGMYKNRGRLSPHSYHWSCRYNQNILERSRTGVF